MIKLHWVQWGRRNGFIGPKALSGAFDLSVHVSHVKSINLGNINVSQYYSPYIYQEYRRRLFDDSLDLGSNYSLDYYHSKIVKSIGRDSYLYTIANGLPIVKDVECRYKIHEQVSCALDLAVLKNKYDNKKLNIDKIRDREIDTFSNVDLVICPSDAVERYVHDLYPDVNTCKVLYPRPTLDISTVEREIRHKKNLDFIFAGRIENAKGMQTIFRLSAEFSDIKFHLVGQAHMNIPKRNNLIIHGKKDHRELFKLFSESDALIFPSLSEGSSFVTLEALSLGVPGIVSFQSGSHYEHNKTGFIFNAFDYDSCANIVRSIVNDPAILKKCRDNLAKLERYSFDDYSSSLRGALI